MVTIFSFDHMTGENQEYGAKTLSQARKVSPGLQISNFLYFVKLNIGFSS